MSSNIVDTAVSQRVAACEGVNGCAVELPEDYSGDWVRQSGWDHSVIQVMRLSEKLSHYMNLDLKENAN